MGDEEQCFEIADAIRAIESVRSIVAIESIADKLSAREFRGLENVILIAVFAGLDGDAPVWAIAQRCEIEDTDGNVIAWGWRKSCRVLCAT